MTTADPALTALGDSASILLAKIPSRTSETVSPGHRALRRYLRYLIATDIAIIAVSLTVAGLLLSGAKVVTIGSEITIDASIVGIFLGATWFLAVALGRSRDIRIIGSGPTEYRRVVTTTALVFGLDAILMLAVDANGVRAYFLVGFPLGLAGLLIGSKAWRSWLSRQRRRGRFTHAALIVGHLDEVSQTLATMSKTIGAAYYPAGVVIEGPQPPAGTTLGPAAVPVLGTSSDVAATARALSVDAVIVVGQPAGGGDYIRRLGWELERTDADLMIASRLADIAGTRIHFRPTEGLPNLMHVDLPIYDGGKHVAKRAIDIAVSGLALVLLAPVILILALLVRRSGPGPVLFRQQRVGRNGSAFTMLKFRSMVDTAEQQLEELREQNEGDGPLFKIKDDPRVTRVGRVLRKYSLDELPQLWNVLRGEMSLVGPRPPLPVEARQYEEHVQRRLYIRPGLTGMWQVSGRSDLSWQESVRLDLFYVENWSLTGDLMILWRTVKVVLNPVGAY